MAIKINNLNKSLVISLTFFNFIGLWPKYVSIEEYKKYYNVLTAISLSIVFGVLLSECMAMYETWGDIAAVTNMTYKLFTNVAGLCRIITFLYYRRTFRKIVHENECDMKRCSNIELELIRSCDRETFVQMLIHLASAFPTIIIWLITSWQDGDMVAGFWFPFNTSQSPSYELGFLLSALLSTFMPSVNILLHSATITLVAQIKCRFQLLNHSLENIMKDVKETPNGVLSIEDEKLVYKRLRGCVSRHQAILQTITDVQNCISIATFIQFNVIRIIICATAYKLATIKGDTITWIATALFLLAMVYELFLYCYHGDQITEQSENVSKAVYKCNWYKAPIKFKRSISIIMLRHANFIVITVGKFTPLTLDSFIMIIKASYSLFTVLKHATEK